MSAVPAVEKAAPGEFLGAFGSWLKARWPTLYRTPSSPAAAGKRIDPGNPLSLRVLVVDSDPVRLMTISAQLEARGVSALLVTDGSEAVALACDLHFDLILIHLQSARLDGLQVTQAIRQFEARNRHAAVPVVAYAGREVDAWGGSAPGLNGRLSEPCDGQKLDDCLRRWCPTYRPRTCGVPGIGAAGR